MEAITWGFIGTLAGAVIGAASSIVTTTITAKNTQASQRSVHLEKRKERFRDLQGKNLMELQEAITKAMRIAYRIHRIDVESFESEQAQKNLPVIPADIDEEMLFLNRTISVLKERVSDENIRNEIDTTHSKLTAVFLSKSVNESKLNIEMATESTLQLQKMIGAAIRSYY